jgi:hypothetical protein
MKLSTSCISFLFEPNKFDLTLIELLSYHPQNNHKLKPSLSYHSRPPSGKSSQDDLASSFHSLL